jgi:oligopeptidase A
MRNFVLSGAELTGAAKERFARSRSAGRAEPEVQRKRAGRDRCLAYYATAEELDGVPDDVQQAAAWPPPGRGKEGYKLTLKMPCYLPVMQFAQAAHCASACTAPTPRAPPTRPRAMPASLTTAH